MQEQIKRINRELKYKGKIIDIYQDRIQLPEGKVAMWDYVGHKGAAAVLPITQDGKVILVSQYRNTVERLTWEIPAGGIEVGEDFKACAIRELEEETGYKSEDVEFLLSTYPTIAYGGERIEIFLARNLREGNMNLDPHEYINVSSMSLEEINEKIFTGQIQDGKTIAAIMAYQVKYGNK